MLGDEPEERSLPIYFFMRIASILIVLLVATHSPSHIAWFALVYSLGFTHYLLTLLYSQRQFAALTTQPFSVLPLFSMLVFGAGLYVFHFPLPLYFAVPHVFNEAYILPHTLPADNEAVRAFRGSAVLLHLFLYVFLLRCTLNTSFGDTSAFAFFLHTGPCESFVNTNLL